MRKWNEQEEKAINKKQLAISNNQKAISKKQ